MRTWLLLTRVVLVMVMSVGGQARAQVCYGDPQQKPRCFDEMVSLLRKNQADEDKELLMCIFWEESGFCNVKNSAGATGFGQLIIPDKTTPGGQMFWKLVDEAGLKVDAKSILADDDLSVRVASIYVKALVTVLKDRQKAIRTYAGQQYAHVPPAWLACKKALDQSAVFLVPDPSTLPQKDKDEIVAALRKAIPPGRKGAPNPAILFDSNQCGASVYE